MKILLWFLIGALFFVWLIRYVEENNVFFPIREVSMNPSVAGLDYEDIYFKTHDGKKLNGWYIPRSGENSRFVLVFFHGNAGNIGHRLEKILILNRLGLDVFIFDYRGYGNSEGDPSERGVYIDAEAAYYYLANERGVSSERMVLYGESLGGSVATDLAAKKDVAALITEEAFTSLRDMAGLVYPFIPSFLVSDKFDTVSKIKKVNCPKLIIHSLSDEIVPFRLGEKLFDAAKEPKQFLEIRGGHNTAFLDSGEKYKEGLKFFLRKL
jgi:uncharacterized protein